MKFATNLIKLKSTLSFFLWMEDWLNKISKSFWHHLFFQNNAQREATINASLIRQNYKCFLLQRLLVFIRQLLLHPFQCHQVCDVIMKNKSAPRVFRTWVYNRSGTEIIFIYRFTASFICFKSRYFANFGLSWYISTNEVSRFFKLNEFYHFGSLQNNSML